MKNSMNKDFQKMFGALYGGAMVVKGTDLVGHARQPEALVGDIGGFVGLGVAGAAGGAAFKMAAGKIRKRKRKRR